MDSPDLFSLLLARLEAIGALHPLYIGEFSCRARLPRGLRYPPIYVWVDGGGAAHIDTDRATLSRICVLESIRAGLLVDFGDTEVEQAVIRFTALVDEAFEATSRGMAVTFASPKSARRLAALRWRAAR